ncbi:MAG TPA: RloB family protein [bacterium]|nr:RloB family protein [bacterium]
MAKKRKYTKEEVRDQRRSYSMIWIYPEGSEVEVDYFEYFKDISSRIKVVINNDADKEKKDTRSANKWLIDRYAEIRNNIDKTIGDSAWFIIDVDRKSNEDIHNLDTAVRDDGIAKVIISNPCFEVWKLYHCNHSEPYNTSCQIMKTRLHEITKGKSHPLNLLSGIYDAIKLAKSEDPQPGYFFPKPDVVCYSKVYELIEYIQEKITVDEFNNFIKYRIPEKLDAYNRNITERKSGG